MTRCIYLIGSCIIFRAKDMLLTLPKEILYLISLYSEPYQLSLCILLSEPRQKLYTDTWFRDKLQLLCPNLTITLNVTDTSKELYRRFLNTGEIHRTQYQHNRDEFQVAVLEPLACKGIKATICYGGVS